MNEKITVCIQKSKMDPQVTLGSFDFTEAGQRQLKIDSTIEIPGGVSLRLKGALSTGNNAVSLGGFVGENQLFLTMMLWDKLTPYFGVQLEGIGWLHIYFSKRNPGESSNQQQV